MNFTFIGVLIQYVELIKEYNTKYSANGARNEDFKKY